MKKIYLFITLITFTIMLSCNNDDDNNEKFDTSQMIADITDNIIITKITSFTIACEELNNAILTYVDNINNENLIDAQNKWVNAASIYAELYVFNIGESKKQLFNKKLYNWPTYNIAIENFIENNDTITEENVANISSQAKTLSGIEYLLFSHDNTNEINGLFINSEKRKEYLRLITSNQLNQANNLEGLWSSDGGNYRDIFVNNAGTGLSSSLNMLYNGIYNVIATAKITKIGSTAGLENSDIINLDELQAPYKGYTKELIIQNIKISKQVFFNENGLGISNNLSVISGNEELNTLLEAKFDNVLNSLENLNGTLANAIQNNPESVKTIHEQLNEIMVILAVDVRSVLSIVITATDNDGD